MSTVNCEESLSTLVQKLYFELRVQVTLWVQIFLTAEEKYYLPHRAGKRSRTLVKPGCSSPASYMGSVLTPSCPHPICFFSTKCLQCFLQLQVEGYISKLIMISVRFVSCLLQPCVAQGTCQKESD